VVSEGRPELDRLPPEQVVELLLRAEQRVVPAVRDASECIVAAARLVADAVLAGGRVVFAGAGTSGRLAVVEAAELPGTFGLGKATVVALLAGGATSLAGVDADEDDAAAARAEVAELDLGPGDVLVAAAVSGSTPYTVAAAQLAAAAGAGVVAVVARPDTPLSATARVAVVLDVGPEVVRGSTRLSAGTAQKVAMDAITTTAMVLAGRVHGDQMIDVVPANLKLRERVVDIVADIAGSGRDGARQALEECDWNARAAVVRLRLGLDPADAHARVAKARTLRDALEG
jgi:N-acetylmuramic acid 6-phosphate etherase